MAIAEIQQPLLVTTNLAAIVIGFGARGAHWLKYHSANAQYAAGLFLEGIIVLGIVTPPFAIVLWTLGF